MQTLNLINGQWIAATTGAAIDVHNPATDEAIAQVPSLDADAARTAIDAAWDAWPAWRSRSAADRAGIIARLADLMHRDADRLARLMTIEQGKPLAEAKGEIAYAASFLQWAAEEAKRLYGDIIPASSTDKRILAIRQPVGPCAIITPWNFPAAMITRKLGPALACGCTAIIKPAELTPLSALAIGELAIEAGVPDGVINIITGDSATVAKPLFEDARIRKLSFTGSTAVGRKLMQQASENILRISLELGGHAPLIVFDDADLDIAVAQAIASKFRNAGQTCICANRIYVQDAIHDRFVERFIEQASALKVGSGLDEGVRIGPLISDDAIAKVERHVEDAAAKGAQLRLGGSRRRIEGLANRFFEPTVLTGMTHDMLCAREETFGPVAPIARFASEDDAVALANDSEFGLAAYFFTTNASRAMRVAEALEYGIVGINDGTPSTAQAPFGGVKHSGLGREGGRYAMDEYSELKYLSWSIA